MLIIYCASKNFMIFTVTCTKCKNNTTCGPRVENHINLPKGFSTVREAVDDYFSEVLIADRKCHM